MMSDASDTPPDDLRPVIATGGSGNWGMWAFVAVLLVGGAWLFMTLNNAREAATSPAFPPSASSADRISSPPPLAMPAPSRVLPVDLGPPEPEPRAPAPPQFVPPGPPPPVFAPAPEPFVPPQAPPAFVDPPRGPAVVFDRAIGDGGGFEPAVPDSSTPTRIANPSFTISQGTIIPAVLETAFDSTRPGRVRALVQRDVFSWDGTRVLVPRGSRLFGEYDAGINPGERRALITWTRLLRPDGVSIALDSPAADPLGRGGVEGDVDSRFFARLGDAFLQTILGVGTGIAISEASGGNSTILALPGSTQNVTGGADRSRRQPVLEIDHGTSVSVYVARDLDFSSVDQ